MKCLLYSVWTFLLINNLSAGPIAEVLETTTESVTDAAKLVTKRDILRDFNQNMLHTVGAGGGNRPFFNWYNNNHNNNNVGVTNPPNRPFIGLFGGLGNRPFLTALQAQQAQAIPALQDDVEGLSASQDMQTVQNVQNVASSPGLQSLQGFHPFQSFQSHLPFHGMHQSMSRPFAGGAGFLAHLPFGMGNHHAGLSTNVAPAHTALGKQFVFSYDPYGLQYFAPTGFPNY